MAVLFVILAFILGTRYGQKVEQTNKAINYLISLPPTKPPPTPIPLEFKTYENKVCGIRFLLPSTINIQYESSRSAKFNENGVMTFQFDCRPAIGLGDDEKIATQEIKFQNKKILAGKSADSVRFIVSNPKNGKSIYVNINQSLFPLFEKSLEFITP